MRRIPERVLWLAVLLVGGCGGGGGVTRDDAGGDAQADAGDLGTGEGGDAEAGDVDAADEASEPPDCALPEPPAAALLRIGMNPDGTRLIPGGRALTPAGTETPLDGFPQQVVVHPDGLVAYVTSASDDDRLLYVVDTATGDALQRIVRDEAFYGLAVAPDGSRVYASSGFGGTVEYYDVLPDGTLSRAGSVSVDGYPAGLALSEDGATLWVGRFYGNTIGNGIVEFDTATMTERRTIVLPDGVFDVLKVPGQDLLFASAFAARRIDVVDLAMGTSLDAVTATSSPEGLAARPDGTRVWAAVSGGDQVIAIDTATRAVVGQTWVGDITLPGDSAPLLNSSPSALWYESATDRLYVTRAGDNAVTVLDATTLDVLGSIPTGWYPTSVAFTPDGATMIVTQGKGGASGPNPGEDIKDWMMGSVLLVDVAHGDLAAWTEQVEANYRRPESVFPFDFPAACAPPFPIPVRPGDATPIRHVVLVVKENKSFDCVFGDFPGAEADDDPDYLMWGDHYTPNQHALAAQFTLGDNFYTDSECSAQGHLWLTGAFVTEYMERMWIENYRNGDFAADADLDQGQPDAGTLFMQLIRSGIDFTNYGEVTGAMGSVGGESVLSHTDLNYPGTFFNLDFKDEDKANYVADKLIGGDFPPFVYIGLPNDHTKGTSPGELTPAAMINDNDYGLGLLVDRISHSTYWESTAIFVVEDDPQSCSDHIDPHRSFLLVISPWARHGHITHVNGSFMSVFRTIERILGLPPLGRTDAMATPLWDSFTNAPDDTPYDALARTIPDETSKSWYPGAQRSQRLDFSGPDRAPELFPILRAYQLWRTGRMSYDRALRAADAPAPDAPPADDDR